MEAKQRFKLYKSGKTWKVMALMAAVVGGLSATTITGAADATVNEEPEAGQVIASPDVKSEAVADDHQTLEAASVTPSDEKTDAEADVPANQPLKNGQVTENGATYFYDHGQMKTNYFQTDEDGQISYYGADGKMYQDKFYQNWGNVYYFQNNGKLLVNGFYQNWGRVYYFGDAGIRYTNKFYQNWGRTYYFGADGARYTKQFYQNWGRTYYFGEDGALYTNREYNNWGNKYYFTGDGSLLTNGSVALNGHNYLANGEGILNFDYLKPSETKPYPNVKDVNRIVVDIRGNRVRLYNGDKLLYTMNCTAGKYVNGRSLTPSGTYAIQAERGGQFMNHTVGMGANYYTSWLNHGEYLFHSVVIDEKGNYIPSEAAKLGKTQGSHGCIRLSVPDAKYMMGMRVGTNVEIFG